MRVFRDPEGVIGRETGCVAAGGNFDGVHLGHQAVIAEAVGRARAKGAPALLLTFSVHPVRTLQPERPFGDLMTLRDRLGFAEGMGMDSALLLPFNRALALQTPEEFADAFLVRALGASEVVVGENWRFGRDRGGDVGLLTHLGSSRGFSVTSVPPVRMEGGPVSSTRIREALARGEVEKARRLLGRCAFVRGKVVPGHGTGKRLGFPTVNIRPGSVLLPADGVYAGAFTAGELAGPAALFIGTRRTFGPGQRVLEAHLPGFSGDLYGRRVTLGFTDRLRPEERFPDEAALSGQITRDVGKALSLYDASCLEGLR